MPGRSSPPDAAQNPRREWSIEFTSVPELWPAAGCTTIPAGLSSHYDVGILVHDLERQRLRDAVARPEPGGRRGRSGRP